MTRGMSIRLALALALALALVPSLARGEAIARCDAGLVDRVQGRTAYQAREGRCEGIYAQPVNAELLTIRSFTEGFLAYDITREEAIRVEWSGPPPTGLGSVHLRANALKRDLRYRMDAEIHQEASFTWPLDLVGILGIEPKDLGLLAWRTDTGEATSTPRHYLPVRTGSAGGRSTSPDYRVVVVANRRVDDLKVHLKPLRCGGSGDSASWVESWNDLRHPPQQPLEIVVPRPPSAGLFCFRIRMVVEGGDSGVLDLLFLQEAF